MGRPSKSAKVLTECSQTKAEIAARVEAENKLKGNGLPVAPKYLSKTQRGIFNRVVDQLKDSDILSELDSDIIGIYAVALDRITEIERRQNEEPELFCDSKLLSAKEKYSKEYFRCSNELCLSPQSRAKMAIATTAKKTVDPLLEVLKE